MTIEVTSAKCERCFSALKIIKTHRQSTMNDEDRLNDIAILSIEKDLSNQLDLDIYNSAKVCFGREKSLN